MEELEAIDWYDQRAIASGDDEPRAVLEHNRDDEKEHAAMAARMAAPPRPCSTSSCASTCSPRARSPRRKTNPQGDAGSGSLGIGDLRTEVTP